MNLTQRITSNSEFFYKKKDLPTIKVGDKVKVLNYLELHPLYELYYQYENLLF